MDDKTVWTVTVLTRGGTKTVKIAAESKDVALSLAREHGSPVSASREGGLLKRGLTAAERRLLLERIATLSASDVGFSHGLSLIRDNLDGPVGQAAGRLLDAIHAGMTLPDAMALHPKDFPPDLVAIIRAGVASGSTERAMADAVRFEDKFGEVRRKAGKGLPGAIGYMVFTGLFTIALQGWLVPFMNGMPLMQSGEKSEAYVTLMGAADATGTVLIWTVVLSLLLLAGIGWLSTFGRRICPMFSDAVIAKIPLYRDVSLSFANFATLYRLSLLIESGINLEQALTLVAESARKGMMRRDVEAAAQAVRDGLPWTDAMDCLDPIDRHALSSSTDRKQMARTLDAVAKQYESLYERRLTLMVPVIKFAAYFMLAIAVLVMGIETGLPPFEMVMHAGKI